MKDDAWVNVDLNIQFSNYNCRKGSTLDKSCLEYIVNCRKNLSMCIFYIYIGTTNNYKLSSVDCIISGNPTPLQDTLTGFIMEYGIALIPDELISDSAKAQYNSDGNFTGGYIHSSIHTSSIPAMVNKFTNVLGNHIVTRNVLLSSSNTGTNSSSGTTTTRYSSSYTWTTSKATLMSAGQLTGTFGSHNNKYDDGEATYKLPLFDHTDISYGYNGSTHRPSYTQSYQYWLRNIKGAYRSGSTYANTVRWEEYDEDGKTRYTEGVYESYVTSSCLIRPLIYIR